MTDRLLHGYPCGLPLPAGLSPESPTMPRSCGGIMSAHAAVGCKRMLGRRLSPLNLDRTNAYVSAVLAGNSLKAHCLQVIGCLQLSEVLVGCLQKSRVAILEVQQRFTRAGAGQMQMALMLGQREAMR